MRIRFLAIAHFTEGKNRTQISQLLKVSRRMVNEWVSNYLAGGIKALEIKKQPGRPPTMTAQQSQELSAWVNLQACSDEGGRITGTDVKNYLQTQFGISFHLNHVYKILKQLGFSWITSRSRHPKQSQEVIESFKKIQN